MEKLGRAGVDSRKQVVAYDAQGGMVASRLWWMLRWLGHLPVAVLDGGWDRWVEEGRPQTSEAPRAALMMHYDSEMILTALVSPEILAQRLDDPDWVVLDCRHDLADPARGRAEYGISHIPGARFLHLDDDLSAPRTGKNGRHPLPDPDTFMEKLGRAGVDSRKQVVAYDAQAGMVAARLWWMLRALGHLPVAVLDGGWNQWIGEGRAQTAEAPRAQPTRFSGKMANGGWVSASVVRSRLDDPAMLLVDARAPDRYRGQNETLDPVGGRIPGARNRYFRDNLDSSGRFKSPEELEREFRAVLGANDPQDVVSYCGSGVSACHNLLAMEVAGLRGARLYPGSWSEWSADPSRPIATGEPKPGER